MLFNDIAGKVVLITGTSSGQGRTAALAFAAAGAKVYGCDLNAPISEETLRLVRQAGGTMRSMHPLDISSEANALKWVAAAKAEFGRIDVLYTNAGQVVGHSEFGQTTLQEWEGCIRHELTTVFLCSKAV